MEGSRSLAKSLETLRTAAIRWAVGGVGQPVVDAAVDVLVAGHDTPTLRVLAGAARANADHETAELGPRLFEELGMVIHPRWCEAAYLDWARLLVREYVAGERLASSLAGELGAAGFSQWDGPLREWAYVCDRYGLAESGVYGLRDEVEQEIRELATQLLDGDPLFSAREG